MAQLADAVDDHGEALAMFTEVVVSAVEDGNVTRDELRLIFAAADATAATYRPIPARVSLVGEALSLIGTLAECASPTATYEKRAKRAMADEARLRDQGLVSAIAAD